MTSTNAGRIAPKVAYIDLAILYAIAVASAAGYGIFRAWPQLLATVPNAMAVYPRAFQIFPRAQIVIAFIALAVFLTRHARWRWVLPFVALYAISLSSELLGTTVGLPFGPYRYTDALGMKWFGHVPALIPVSWFMMALPSYALARAARGDGSRWRRVVVGSLILLAWDLALDPAMSAATKFWIWGSEGPYYGMPWLNLFGWFVTGVVLMAALAGLRAERWCDALPRRWLAAYYGANLALPIGLAIAAGMWGALAATAAALVGCWLFVRPSQITQRAAA